MTMLKEQAALGILNLEVPSSFASRQEAAKTVVDLKEGKFAISELQRQLLRTWIEVLDHPELQTLIDEDKITLFAIKPQAYEGKNLPKDDQEAANLIQSEIGADEVIGPISLQLTRDQAEKFYEPNRESQTRKITPEGSTVWDLVISHSTSGPISFGLLYYENGDAVLNWR